MNDMSSDSGTAEKWSQHIPDMSADDVTWSQSLQRSDWGVEPLYQDPALLFQPPFTYGVQ